MNGWKDHFLVGNNQYGAPYVVAFRVNDECDTVGIYGYTRIHPMSENRRNPRFAPLLPSALGMIVTSPRFNAIPIMCSIQLRLQSTLGSLRDLISTSSTPSTLWKRD